MHRPPCARSRIVSALTLPLIAASTHGDIFNVPADGPLSVVIALANSGDEIVVSDSGSPYLLFPGISFTDKQLTIRGSTGNRNDVVISGADLDVVFTVNGAGSDGTIFQDLTITSGFVASTDPINSDAAGLRIYDANVSMINCAVVGNRNESDDGDGAAIYVQNADLSLIDCLVQGNTLADAGADSAAIFGTSANLTLVDSQFIGNRIDDLVVPETGAAGAILATNGSLQALRCVFERNRGGAGGGVHVSNTTVSILDRCEFLGNVAGVWGGGLYSRDDSGLTTIRNSTFVGNLSLGNDAAIFTSAALHAENCTFTGNQATGNFLVGGSPADRRVVVMDNSVFWGNDTGLFVPGSGTNFPIIRSCIVEGGFASANGSGNNLDVDPLLTALPAIGVDMEWGTLDDDYGDMRPTGASPCIDAGDSDQYAGPFVDLDGNDRAVDDPNTMDTGLAIDGPVIDIGAFETQAGVLVPFCEGDADGSGDVNFGDITAVLGNWLVVCPN